MSEAADITLLSYASSLSDEAKSCYLQKIGIIGGIDPFCTGTLGYLERSDDYPPVDACDLLSYLVLRTSFITTEQFVARKGLRHTINSCVAEVVTWKAVGKFVTTGTVRNNPQIECNLLVCLQVFHSQRLSDTLIIEQDGQVCCAHCNCMTGLGEVCTQ